MHIPPKELFNQIMNKKPHTRPLLDLGGQAWSIMDGEPFGYKALCNYLGIRNIRITRRHGSNVVYPIDERVYQKLHIDFRHLRMREPKDSISDNLVFDGWGAKRKRSKDNWYPVDPPLKDITSEKEIEEYNGWPNPEDPIYIEGIHKIAKEVYEDTDYILCLDPAEAREMFSRYAKLRGFENLFIDMKRNPELFNALSEKILEINTDLMTVFLNEVGDYASVISFGDDFGAQRGPFLSPSDFRNFCKPYISHYFKVIKKLAPKIKIIFHSDGAIFPLIGEIIDTGADILNPLQPDASGMEPENLVKEFGGKVCFHGGIDVTHLLPRGSVEEIESAVLSRIGILKDSGYILAPSQAVGADIPPKNIQTMYNTGYNYGNL